MGRFDHSFPFAAVAGQEKVKEALLLCAVNPAVGGVLLAGEKGTAKSTLVRGLAALLEGASFVELPLNVTEDRLVGAIDLEAALRRGDRAPEYGLLKAADGGFLYVDEVNLLSEHIVNILLEVSSVGENVVEREGVSFRHPARFVLVGSMNPEEGHLRSHFVDRFGLYVPTRGEQSIEVRCTILRRRLDYERDPIAFEEQWAAETEKLRTALRTARSLLPEVVVGEDTRRFAAGLAREGRCAGHRAELTLCEAARARAALDGRREVTKDDIKAVAPYALPHRLREAVSLEEPSPQPEMPSEETEVQPKRQDTVPDPLPGQQGTPLEQGSSLSGQGIASADERWENIQPTGQSVTLGPLSGGPKAPAGTGKRLKVRSHSGRGRYIRAALPRGKPSDLAFDATLRAAAAHPGGADGQIVTIRADDLREKVREQRTGAAVLFLVDASGSMGAKRRMGVVKGAVLSLLSDVYEKRDTVGLLAFRKDRADVLLPLTRSVDLAEKYLRDLKTGGKTPLAHGLAAAYDLLKTDRIKHPNALQYLVVVSDGRANVPLWEGPPVEDALRAARRLRAEGVQSLVLDPEEGFMQLGMAQTLADALGGTCIKLRFDSGREVSQAVRDFL